MAAAIFLLSVLAAGLSWPAAAGAQYTTPPDPVIVDSPVPHDDSAFPGNNDDGPGGYFGRALAELVDTNGDRYAVIGATSNYLAVHGENRVHVLDSDGNVVKTIRPVGRCDADNSNKGPGCHASNDASFDLSNPSPNQTHCSSGCCCPPNDPECTGGTGGCLEAPSPTSCFNCQTATPSGGFGSSLAVVNGLIAVGAPLAMEDSGEGDGKVFLYDPMLDVAGKDTWELIAVYLNTDDILPSTDHENFGNKVAALGDDRLLVSRSRRRATPTDNVDRVYVFTVPPARSCSGASPDACSSDGDCPSGETCRTVNVENHGLPACSAGSPPPCYLENPIKESKRLETGFGDSMLGIVDDADPSNRYALIGASGNPDRFCSGNATKACNDNDDCPLGGDGECRATCSHNHGILCTVNTDCSGLGVCEEDAFGRVYLFDVDEGALIRTFVHPTTAGTFGGVTDLGVGEYFGDSMTGLGGGRVAVGLVTAENSAPVVLTPGRVFIFDPLDEFFDGPFVDIG
ncbi:MAG: hypothetical protein ABGY28_01090, partial [bacterium]